MIEFEYMDNTNHNEHITYHGADYVETMALPPEKATVVSDLKILDGIDFEKYELQHGVGTRYGDRVVGEEAAQDTEQALLDMSWKVRLEDGTSDEALVKIKELIKDKGLRAGFVFAITFLNDCESLDWHDKGVVKEEKRNRISDELQDFLCTSIEDYILVIDRVNEDNRELVENDITFLGMAIGRSVEEILLDEELASFSSDDIERIRTEKKPASNNTYLNIDNTFRLLNLVDKFGSNQIIRDNYEIESAVLVILEYKKQLVDKGVSFDQ